MSAAPKQSLTPRVASALNLPERKVHAVLTMLADKATVPFIARYRKEATGNLDEVQIRAIAETHTSWAELEKRRTTIINTIRESGMLTPTLEQRLLECDSRTSLEDIYLPFRPKRRTKATVARERGLEPLARRIIEQPQHGHPLADAKKYVSPNKDVPDVDSALAGARDIVAERVAERADIRALVRTTVARFGTLTSKKARGQDAEERTQFEQYYKHSEPFAKVPSHRYLAMARGERDGILSIALRIDADRLMNDVIQYTPYTPRSPYAEQFETAALDSLNRLILPAVERELRKDAKLHADKDAVHVFAKNLRALLLAAPLGQASVIGIDPGLRTGCKCVALDATGKLLEHTVIYTHRETGRAEELLTAWVHKYKPRAIAVGNGTGSREAMAVARKAANVCKETAVVEVNEAGASVYSASDVAREEFPELDLTVRGAISIGRRLQDPLAELVKVEPKAIGVGQYQHDVDQSLLADTLNTVVESCVNHVGVELNTASAALLSFVAGIGPTLAKKIVLHRNTHGPFRLRKDLMSVPGLGARTFEQCAGFLRISDSANPLDASAVHPERYKFVSRMASHLGVSIQELCGNVSLVQSIRTEDYVDQDVGLLTLNDILSELSRPGRDPRDSFESIEWAEEITDIEHLHDGMVLKGKVTNVTHFGAFVDIGVHQDGLVHISELSEQWIDDPHSVVQPGQTIDVRVLSVDTARRRIALSAKL